MDVISNDTVDLRPATEFPGASVVLDVPGVEVGQAEYAEGPTGATVLVFDRRSPIAVDVGGGNAGVIGESARAADAVCLAGGSGLGFGAIAGVTEELFARRGYVDGYDPPQVVGGVIEDFGPPGRTAVFPDSRLGRAAARSAFGNRRVALGQRGCGRSASCGGMIGREPGGQGGAAGITPWDGHLGVVVVNSWGVVTNRDAASCAGTVAHCLPSKTSNGTPKR